MKERKQESSVQNDNIKPDRIVAASGVFTPPSRDEEAFLKSIEQAGESYDPKVIVGGPSNFRA
ncbi:hypothetical protein MXD81_31395 [Microbacteriaceae bacterium K1510]|nr:hypothetical protein [Microbacteriaceae bacterium K1510]